MASTMPRTNRLLSGHPRSTRTPARTVTTPPATIPAPAAVRPRLKAEDDAQDPGQDQRKGENQRQDCRSEKRIDEDGDAGGSVDETAKQPVEAIPPLRTEELDDLGDAARQHENADIVDGSNRRQQEMCGRDDAQQQQADTECDEPSPAWL